MRWYVYGAIVGLLIMLLAWSAFPSEKGGMVLLQRCLTVWGLYEGPIDGIGGPQTQKACDVWSDQYMEGMKGFDIKTYRALLMMPQNDLVELLSKVLAAQCREALFGDGPAKKVPDASANRSMKFDRY